MTFHLLCKSRQWMAVVALVRVVAVERAVQSGLNTCAPLRRLWAAIPKCKRVQWT